MIHFRELPQIAEGRLIQLKNDLSIQNLLTDSRSIILKPESVFFAIKGANHDGHDFIEELYHQGLRQFVIDDTIDLDRIPGANVFSVPDTLRALQLIAQHHRSLFDLPVLAITGSNGKTIVKEWLSQMLAKHFDLIKSPKSYNSQIGVPLSVWNISEQHNLGIFEAGISQKGEMEKLEDIIRPTWGIFTNLLSAHDEGFASREEKALEKARLFQHCDKIIYRKEYLEIEEALLKLELKPDRFVGWSTQEDSSIHVKFDLDGAETGIIIHFDDNEFSFRTSFQDTASLENLTHSILFMLSIGITYEQVQDSLNDLAPIKMRLELKPAVHESYLIDDTYNNDLAGLEVALNFTLQQQKGERTTLILSDLLQQGLQNSELYQRVAKLLKEKSIDRFIGIGPDITEYKSLFSSSDEFYDSTINFLKSLNLDSFKKELVLIKGARAFEFEKIVRALQQKDHGTVLEIDLNALVHNLNFYRSKLSPETKIMVMVKAFAYGSGITEVAHLLQYHKVDYLAVAYADEGVTLRQAGITLPIMVMNPTVESLPKIFDYDLEPEIYNFSLLNALCGSAREQIRTFSIHLKIDTGMKRLGFEKEDLDRLIDIIINQTNVHVKSILSHLAGADEGKHNSFSKDQATTFSDSAILISNGLGYNPTRHLVNSAGILRFPEYHFDMVRLGIGLYGIDANDQYQSALLPISTLKTTISQVKSLKAGETVGYGRRGIAETDMQIATIAIGYADGFSRQLSNGKGAVLIKGKLAPVIGTVCMDMTMADVTGIDAQEGDEVIIFGKEKPIQEIAQALDTIPYEILTSVGERVKRTYYSD